MLDRIIGIVALGSLCAFFAVLPVFVPSLDLAVVLAVTAVLAGNDFYRSLFRRRDPDR